MRPSDQPTFTAPRRARPVEYVPGQIIVGLDDDAVRKSTDDLQLAETITELLDYLLRDAGALSARPLFAPAGGRTGAASKLLPRATEAPPGLAGVVVVELPDGRVPQRVLKRVESAPAVDYVERMPARRLLAAPPAPDPLRNRQWGLRAIRWFQAPIPDATNVLVAIADTGVDSSHPDLGPAIAEYHHDGASATDIVGHGSHVSGIVAAVTNNGIGITGVSNARLGVWKIFPDTPTDGAFYVDGTRYLRALEEISRSGAKALNLSIGGPASSQTEQLLFDRLESAGVTVAAAMGNEYEDGNPTEYPAAYKGVLAIGASEENDERAPFSNTGPHIGLVAPGVNVLSTVPTRKSAYRPETNYASWSGTSMATPHVTAAAALLAAVTVTSRAADVKARLLTTARKPPAMDGRKRTNAYGNGVLDLEAALVGAAP